MTRPHFAPRTAERQPLSLRTQVRAAFDGLIKDQPWTNPARRFAGRSTSTRELHLIDPETESTVVLSETQRYRFLFGVPISIGQADRHVTWTVREGPQVKGQYPSPHAEVLYRDGEYDTPVRATYFMGFSQAPVEDIWNLEHFSNLHDVYPNPQIKFKPEAGLTEMAFLLQQRIPNSYVEQVDLAPVQ